ncbi:MAG: alpha-1,2-fucosyltransferase [Anaerohalosphaera sp.]|nr:alpha-1,2-fucosyltransferase [Anaerohalosphaera sp.]
MLIANIIGGLGNQMFQYAFVKALALRKGVEFKLDISGFIHYKLHDYSLDNLNIDENLADENEVEMLKVKGKGRAKKFHQKLLTTLTIRSNTHFIEEYPYSFDKRVWKLPNSVYLEGYWNCYRYFKDIRAEILKDFKVHTNQTGKDLEVSMIIKDTNSVSIHVRRCDYVTNAKTQKHHGICGLDYYRDAIKRVSGIIRKPTFFVFSDDHQWVKENLKMPYEIVYVDHNGPCRNYEDMRLMSQCRSNIIANSTFSWWAGWLNNYEDKIVVAPEKWVSSGIDIDNLLPKEWIKL